MMDGKLYSRKLVPIVCVDHIMMDGTFFDAHILGSGTIIWFDFLAFVQTSILYIKHEDLDACEYYFF